MFFLFKNAVFSILTIKQKRYDYEKENFANEFTFICSYLRM